MKRILAFATIAAILGIHAQASACSRPINGTAAFLAKIDAVAKILAERDPTAPRDIQTEAAQTAEADKPKPPSGPRD
ncbi:MAG: hypothetical protein QF578_09330 [Alphaproteobacteria bacterium]|nr:hypothetical protein [Alphaproteobacteria bacterium]MDP6811951.1 hypothetical protein [Alphaproteobacteria bacterium]